MDQFNVLMDFVRDTREQQQKYLETIRTENTALIEYYRNESISLINQIEKGFEKGIKIINDDLRRFKSETKTELGSVRRWYASTIVAIVLTGGAIALSIWLK